jgi:hypothetical protein
LVLDGLDNKSYNAYVTVKTIIDGYTASVKARRPSMELVLIVAALLLLGFAATRWGVDSREDVYDPEWDRRKAWRGYSA